MSEYKYPYQEVAKLLALAYYRRYIICQKGLDKGENPSINVNTNSRNGEEKKDD